MADDKSKAGGQERTRIDVNEDYESRDWAKRFGVSGGQLKAAVKAVGTSASAVEKRAQGIGEVDPMATNTQGLERFVEAQAPIYKQVLEELGHGRKATHWMWYVFPQLRGLGHSSMAQTFGLASAQEAAGYMRHPILGQRLLHCTQLVLATKHRSAHEIFGSPDDLKFRSCMTLFASIAPEHAEFQRALIRFYAGEQDERTSELLASQLPLR